jgi:magnesium transporter
MMEHFYLEKVVKKSDRLEDKRPVWIDVTNMSKEEENLLKERFNLHPLTSEDLYNDGIRIKIEEFNDYLLCIFYGARKEKEIKLFEMDFIIGKDFLITNHKKKIESFEELKSDEKKLKMIMEKGIDFLFHRLLDIEIDNFIPVLEMIDDNIEKIEEKITKNLSKTLMTDILEQKREIVSIKKIIMPQREKISFLAKNDTKFISKKAVPYFRDIYDHSIRVSDSIDNYREAIGSSFDAYMSTVSNNMNDVMKTLSIIATIALPLTVISGVYGTNFITLPGSTAQNGFWVMVGVMAAMMFTMLFYFRKKRWI